MLWLNNGTVDGAWSIAPIVAALLDGTADTQDTARYSTTAIPVPAAFVGLTQVAARSVTRPAWQTLPRTTQSHSQGLVPSDLLVWFERHDDAFYSSSRLAGTGDRLGSCWRSAI